MYGAEEITYRLVKRDCYCRGCDKLLKRGIDKAISFHSYRNRGQHVKLCVDCVNVINKLVNESKV